ncbi:hypothetical protein F0L17_05890 [Streptomyces sp. TRM43335]|uniref:Bacterioferritin-associated ferredoxin n=1 Tax=Streptomyces taklimakanensis TaxID=2569853 RepID=A0A6G2B9U3_9ACTN|nr:hypothetical protein [Streptomyces taklimakanensis]
MYVCSCFGVTEEQIREHAAAGACTPREIASASRAGTDCGSCVRRIQGLLGRGGCPRRDPTVRSLPTGRTSDAPAEASGAPAPAVPGVPGVPAPPALPASVPAASAAPAASSSRSVRSAAA